MPCGENGRNPSRQHEAEHFLWSGLKAKGAKLRPFPLDFRAIQADFSTLQIVW